MEFFAHRPTSQAVLTANGVVDSFAELTGPWASLYSNSPTVQVVVMFLHLGGIFLGGGFAIATDRETFEAVRARVSGQMRHLAHLHNIHRPVMVGVVMALGSGLLLFAADIQTFARSWVFWVKMFLLALLLTNGYWLARTERTLRATAPDSPVLWARLRLISAASMILWLALILAGTLLMNVA